LKTYLQMELVDLGLDIYNEQRSFETSRKQFEAEMDLEKRTHLMESFMEMQTQFILLDSDLVSSSRDAERDSFDHHNQRLQNLIISCTVMFAATSTIVIQGNISDPHFFAPLKVLYSISNGLSFATLFVSFTICMEVITACSRFMITKATAFTAALADARRNTKTNFQSILAERFVSRDSKNPLNPDQYMNETKINDLWEEIEEKTTKRLSDRRDLVTKFIKKVTFEDFWEYKCSDKYSNAVRLFYIGTFLMLLSSVIYVGVQFTLKYHVWLAALFTAFLLLCAALMSSIFLRVVRGKIEIARILVLRLKKGDEVEVRRKDSCFFCPYWEKAVMLSDYFDPQTINNGTGTVDGDIETGPHDNLNGNTGGTTSNVFNNVHKYVRVQFSESGEVLDVHYKDIRRPKLKIV
jgi:hypothetical protein